ncbi:MAG TPA: 1,2-phenylacetyl-CoA epoxidase subunit PaaD [Rhodopila sp.]|uniref:1,2-phenylacetyl-CoA epoxidase subunit PaaD n=1 Tax=Rhodopila sp. TaxID=2480087 RepID=UPI002BD35580|nr:1,2-phenylacetyl-CoA epoxidase subunit PaaD [Rhodopila sp.]HVY17116.1 1,2-phenylacetyl-CoA epoxidase subunit PaaD [Rhodopila sp.]
MVIPVEQVWHWLDQVPDPEIPVVSITDLGIVRDISWDDDTLVIAVTPTYSGCPATAVINLDIETALRGHGVEKLRLERRLSPPWTTDWIGSEAQAKLRAYGIAPPSAHGPAACPHCGSGRLEKISQFGSTPCKAAYRCQDCLEPFDYFKCI